MPNTGRPSRGCRSCKRQKVRCDENRPQCDRCTRANRVCPGYEPTPDVFRYQSPGSGSNKGKQLIQTRQAQDIAVITTTNPSPPPDPSPEDWLQQALRFFFWTNTARVDPNLGYFDFLEDYYFSRPHPSYFVDALRAISLTNFAHRAPGVPWISRDALRYRAQALHGVRDVLGDLEQARRDDVLLSLFLIERSELSDMNNQNGKLWSNHAAGISAIIHLRGEHQFNTELGRHLFRWTNPQLVMKDFAYGTNWAYEGMPDSTYPRESGAQASKAVTALTKLIRRFRQTLGASVSTPVYQEKLQEILHDLHSLEESLQNYSGLSFEPTSSATRTFVLSGSLTPFTTTIYYFKNLSDAINWTFYWMIKFRIQRVHIDCLKELATTTSQASLRIQEVALLDQLAHFGDQICGIIAFFLSQVNGPDEAQPADPFKAQSSFMRAIWALSGCNAIGGTPELDALRPNMRPWVLDCLLQIGNIYGLKQAYAFHQYFSRGGFTAQNARHQRHTITQRPTLSEGTQLYLDQ